MTEWVFIGLDATGGTSLYNVCLADSRGDASGQLHRVHFVTRKLLEVQRSRPHWLVVGNANLGHPHPPTTSRSTFRNTHTATLQAAASSPIIHVFTILRTVVTHISERIGLVWLVLNMGKTTTGPIESSVQHNENTLAIL